MSKKLRRIHVNQHNIKANAKDGGYRPVITVKAYDENLYGHEVVIRDDNGKPVAKIVYPEKPLACGARVWIETNNEVEVHRKGRRTVLI